MKERKGEERTEREKEGAKRERGEREEEGSTDWHRGSNSFSTPFFLSPSPLSTKTFPLAFACFSAAVIIISTYAFEWQVRSIFVSSCPGQGFLGAIFSTFFFKQQQQNKQYIPSPLSIDSSLTLFSTLSRLCTRSLISRMSMNTKYLHGSFFFLLVRYPCLHCFPLGPGPAHIHILSLFLLQ